MARKQSDFLSTGDRRSALVFVLTIFVSSLLAYMAVSFFLGSNPRETQTQPLFGTSNEEVDEEEEDGCCRGIENLELWGTAVKWGTNQRLNSSAECCRACKATCEGADGRCLCDSWVFCGDRESCGEKFGECWLKKQKNALFPELQESRKKAIWTSGVIFGKGEGIIGLETDYGTLHIKLMPDCAPHSVAYIVELLKSGNCDGFKIFRAEGRGNSWDSQGNHITDASFGPPNALIQGILETDLVPFKEIPKEACPPMRRGSVAWIGSGPEFFISLANHDEWRRAYTVFGSVLMEDMKVAEKIVSLPTKSDVWNNVNVSLLQNHIPLRLRHIKRGLSMSSNGKFTVA